METERINFKINSQFIEKGRPADLEATKARQP